MTTESAKTAKAKYDKRTAKYYSLKLNQNTDQDLIQQLEALKKTEGIQTYLKRLIRNDITKGETTMENKIWYAVQRNSEDDWSTGSESLTKAIQMARKQSEDYPETIVAVIENDTCIDEISDFSEDAWQMLYAFYGNPDWQELNDLIRFESGVQEPYCETEDDYFRARKEGFIKFDGKMTTIWED